MPRCCNCGKNKKKSLFSKRQLRQTKNKIKCKSCISKSQKQIAQKKQQNQQMQKNQKPININSLFDESVRKEAAKFEEPGQVSFLQKLHQHCIGRSIFTELHLSIIIDPSILDPNVAQAMLERRFNQIPDTFVYHDKVIIASKDVQFHMVIYLQMKQYIPYKFIDYDTRLCCNELLYKNGKISNKGVEFYDNHNTIYNCDISELISHTLPQNIEEKNDEEKVFKDANLLSEKWVKLQKNLKSIRVDLNQLKAKLSIKKNKIKAIIDDNILIKWSGIRTELMKKSDHVFDQNNLATIKTILTAVLVFEDNECIGIHQMEGQLNDVVLTIKTSTIKICRNLKNIDFIIKLDNIINQIAEKIVNTDQFEAEEKINISHNGSGESISKLIDALKTDIENCQIKITHMKTSFKQCVAEINSMIDQKYTNCDPTGTILHNFNFPEMTLAVVTDEQTFGHHVVQNKNSIMKWMSKCIDKYEGIDEYGVDFLYSQFITFEMSIQLSFWIAVLRLLSLPISMYNLNLLRKHITQALEQHFIPNCVQYGDTYDAVCVVMYCMNRTPKIYRSKPFRYNAKDSKNTILTVPKQIMYQFKYEPQIIKLCNDCIRYFIKLIPNHNASICEQKMRDHIDAYIVKRGYTSI